MKHFYLFLLAAAMAGTGAWAQTNVLTGDVNGDGTVDYDDALAECRYLVGLDPTPFDATMADVNADGTVNIDDAVAIIEIYTPDDSAAADEAARMMRTAAGYSVSIDNATGEPGDQLTLLISLDNPENTVTSFSMELVLPEGVSVDGDPVLTDRAPNTHDVVGNMISADTYMIVCVSSSLRTFSGTSGALVEVPVRISSTEESGSYEIMLNNVRLVRPRSGGFDVPDAEAVLTVDNDGTTEVEAVATSDTAPEYFTLSGLPATAATRGILIARTAAGTVKRLRR